MIRLLIDSMIKYFEWGYDGESYGGILCFFIEIATIFLCVYHYKTKVNNNTLLFSQGVKVGVGLLLCVGVLFSVYVFIIHGKYIDPNYQQKLIEEASQRLLEHNPNADLGTLNTPKDTKSTYIGLAFWVIKYIFIGLIGGVVSAMTLKTEH